MPTPPHPGAAKAPANSASEAAAPRYYVPELDTLRFFSFLCIFGFHIIDLDLMRNMPLSSWKPGLALHIVMMTGISIDLFFVLSSYLITKLLLKEWSREGQVDIKAYYVRRILRIWPLYYFFAALAFALSRLGGEFSVGPAYMMSILVFFANYGIVEAFAHPAQWHANLVVGPLWTVSAEEQFYLLWPLAIRTGSNRRAAILSIAILAIVLADRIRAGLGILGPPVSLLTVFTHLDSFAVGILLAAVPRFDRVKDLRLLSRVGLVAAGLAAWYFAVTFGNYPNPNAAPIAVILSYPAAAFGSGAFVLAAIGAGKAGARFLLNEWFLYFGRISYGLYVYHGLIITVMQIPISSLLLRWFHPWGWPFWIAEIVYILASFSLTALVAAASYRWLESPFLRLKNRFTHVPSRPV
ncbi:MAG: acyltransferase family protein [Candidatus Binataceae bacterium]